MLITRTSQFTGKEHSMDLPITADQLLLYQRGELAQVAFPHLSPEQREFVMTGCTPEEWAEIFPPEEEECPHCDSAPCRCTETVTAEADLLKEDE